MDTDAIVNAIENIGSRDWVDYTSIVLNVGGLAVAIGTLFFALHVYRRFSLRQQLLEKQLQTVFDLVQSLQNTNLHIGLKGVTDDSKTTFGHFLTFFEMKNDGTWLRDALTVDEKLLFSWEAWDELEFKKFANNPYTPKPIATALRTFILDGPTNQYDDKEFPRLVSLLSYGAYTDKKRMGDDRRSAHQLWHVTDCPVVRNFASVHDACNELIDAINKWLKDYQVADLNLR